MARAPTKQRQDSQRTEDAAREWWAPTWPPLSDGDAMKKLGVQQGNGGRGDLQFPSCRLGGHRKSGCGRWDVLWVLGVLLWVWTVWAVGDRRRKVIEH